MKRILFYRVENPILRVVAIVVFIAVLAVVLPRVQSEAESGILMKLTPTRVCISSPERGGRDVTCWRADDGTDIDSPVIRGDLVTVRHRGDLALSVTP